MVENLKQSTFTNSFKMISDELFEKFSKPLLIIYTKFMYNELKDEKHTQKEYSLLYWAKSDINIFRYVMDGLFLLHKNGDIEQQPDIFDIIVTIHILYNCKYGSEFRGAPNNPLPSMLAYKRVRYYCDRLYPEIFDILDMSEMIEASQPIPERQEKLKHPMGYFKLFKNDYWYKFHSETFGMYPDYIPLMFTDYKITIKDKKIEKEEKKRIFQPGLSWFKHLLERGSNAYYWLYTSLLIALKEEFIDNCGEITCDAQPYYGSDIMTNILNTLTCDLTTTGQIDTLGKNYTNITQFIPRAIEIYEENEEIFKKIEKEADSKLEEETYKKTLHGKRYYLEVPDFDDELIMKRHGIKRELVSLLTQTDKKDKAKVYKTVFNAGLNNIPIPIGKKSEKKKKKKTDRRITFCSFDESDLIDKWYIKDIKESKNIKTRRCRKKTNNKTRKKTRENKRKNLIEKKEQFNKDLKELKKLKKQIKKKNREKIREQEKQQRQQQQQQQQPEEGEKPKLTTEDIKQIKFVEHDDKITAEIPGLRDYWFEYQFKMNSTELEPEEEPEEEPEDGEASCLNCAPGWKTKYSNYLDPEEKPEDDSPKTILNQLYDSGTVGEITKKLRNTQKIYDRKRRR